MTCISVSAEGHLTKNQNAFLIFKKTQKTGNKNKKELSQLEKSI